jgi:hypothetical protein
LETALLRLAGARLRKRSPCHPGTPFSDASKAGKIPCHAYRPKPHFGVVDNPRAALALDMAWILLFRKILAMMDRRWPPAPKPPPPPEKPYIPPRLP